MTTLFITRNGYPIDPGTILRNVEITHGGGYGLDASGGEPSSAVFQLVNIADSYDVTVGDMIQISAELDDATIVPRFTGRVYSRRVDFDSIDNTVTTVAASGNLSVLERSRLAVDFTMPETTDGARVLTAFDFGIPSDSGISYTVEDGGVIYPETTHLSGTPLGELARTYALDALGLVVDLPNGDLAYYDRNHARNVEPVLELDANTVLAGLTVENSTDALINEITVFYGIPDVDGLRSSVAAADFDSQESYGINASYYDSQLLDAGDALDLANDYIYRNSRPRDNLPEISFTNDLIPDGFIDVGIGEVVRVTGLPQPLEPSITGVITGYRELWDFDNTWRIDLELVDGRYWGRGKIWDDIPITETWDTIASVWTWGNIGEYTSPGESVDRWKDQPANYTYTKIGANLTPWSDWTN